MVSTLKAAGSIASLVYILHPLSPSVTFPCYSSILERGSVRVNCLAQENNTITWPGLAYSAGVLLGQANVKNLAIIYSTGHV